MRMGYKFVAAAFAVIALATAPPLMAQGFDYNQIGIEVEVPGPVAPGGSGEVVITLEAPFGFTVTDLPGVFDIIPAGEVPGISFGALIKPAPDRVDEVGGHFTDTTEFRLPFTVAADAAAGEANFTLGFRLQACDEASGLCFLPTNPSEITREAVLQISEAAPGTAGTTQSESTTDEADEDVLDESVAVEPSGEESAVAETSSDDSLEGLFEGSLEGGNIWFAVLLAVGAGIFTSLTPCVYPMIPITISYVSGKAQGQKRNGFFISVVLVLGIAITYSVLGIIAAMTGATFGSYINHPVVQGLLFVVLVAMGFSMLGAFEIALPASMQQKIQVQKSGYVGALGVGLTIGLIAAPCVAPILVIMLTWIATTQNLLLGFILMFAYAIGMGLLFIVVGTFSNAILPKSGMWMEWLKKIFAFVFFIMAVIYAQGLINTIYPGLSTYVIGALLVIYGAVLGAFGSVEPESGWWRLLGKSAGLLLVTVGLIMFAFGFAQPFLPQFSGVMSAGVSEEAMFEDEGYWIRDFDEGLRLAAETGKPMLLDIWATWCIACFELDEFTFSDVRVRALLENEFIAVKIDGTSDSDPAYQKVRAYYAERGYPIVGLPSVFIHNAEGEIVETINRFESADQVLAKMAKAQ